MTLKELFPDQIFISYDQYEKIKKEIDNINQSGNSFENFVIVDKEASAYKDKFNTHNELAQRYEISKNAFYNSISYTDEFKQKLLSYGNGEAKFINNLLKDFLKSAELYSLPFIVYNSEAELKDVKDSITLFIDNSKYIDNKYTKDVSGLFQYINYNDGELVGFNGDTLTKKFNFIKKKFGTPSVTPTPEPEPTPGPEQTRPKDRDGAIKYAIWLLKDSSRYVNRYMVDRYGFNLINEQGTKVTEQDFELMIKPEVAEYLLNNLEPGEINYILTQYINDNPTSEKARALKTGIDANQPDQVVAELLKSKVPGLNDDLYLKLAKSINADPIMIPHDRFAPKDPTPPPIGPGQGQQPPQGGGSAPIPPPAPITPPPGGGPGPQGGPGPSGAPPRISTGPEKAEMAPSGPRGMDPRTTKDSMKPISPQGGPTYYVRTSPGRYRPAIQADRNANMPLYMKNPNPISGAVNPYVRVEDLVKTARRAGPVDQKAMDKEMSAQGYQRVGPGGLRKEKDGSVRRKSQFGGAVGSLSNFLGDVGNTLKKGSR